MSIFEQSQLIDFPNQPTGEAFGFSKTNARIPLAELLVNALGAAHPLAAASKFAFELVLTFSLLVLTLPILLPAMLAIRLTSKGPIFFIQDRIGYGCVPFKMYKLRTMIQGAEESEVEQCKGAFFKIQNDPRVTLVGRLLRLFSIDEIPQLLNVLAGDMCLIGPRPLLLQDFEKFPKDQQLRRFTLKPGITGLWQVCGRSETSNETRMALDLYYVDHWSLLLDLKILLRTIPTVLTGKGAY